MPSATLSSKKPAVATNKSNMTTTKLEANTMDKMGLPRGVWTSDAGSMACETAKTRWPKIVKKMAETVETASRGAQPGSPEHVESENIRQNILAIRQEIIRNDGLSPIDLAGAADEQGYNGSLDTSPQLTWQAAPWLFAECYLYRRVQAIFSASEHWTSFDVFETQKEDSLLASQKAVEGICKLYAHETQQSGGGDAQYMRFIEMLQTALWGNATDLSLISEASSTEISALQEQSTFASARSRIVDDDSAAVWSYLRSSAFQDSKRTIDIVLDNAGFELLTDLVFALYLLDQGLAKTIRLHTKLFSWFVSDAMPKDIQYLMNALKSSETFPRRQYVDPLVKGLQHALDAGKIEIVQHWFWTSHCSFWELPTKAGDLKEQLAASDLVIFKGDLNYRKLTYDGLWPHTTPFEDALGPLGRQSGIKVLALRTNKADVCVGLESEEQVRKLDQACPDEGWVRNGKYAVVSFSDGR